MSETAVKPHQCFADGCNRIVPEHLLMCPGHWQRVPRPLQSRINAAWQATQRGEGSKQVWWQAVQEAKAHLRGEQATPAPEMVLVTGNTFPVKDKLKEMGGKWDPEAKGWRVPNHMKLAAQVLVGNADQVETLPGFEEVSHE